LKVRGGKYGREKEKAAALPDITRNWVGTRLPRRGKFSYSSNKKFLKYTHTPYALSICLLYKKK